MHEIITMTTAYHTKTAQRVPGTTNFFFSTKLPLTIQYIFKGKMI